MSSGYWKALVGKEVGTRWLNFLYPPLLWNSSAALLPRLVFGEDRSWNQQACQELRRLRGSFEMGENVVRDWQIIYEIEKERWPRPWCEWIIAGHMEKRFQPRFAVRGAWQRRNGCFKENSSTKETFLYSPQFIWERSLVSLLVSYPQGEEKLT